MLRLGERIPSGIDDDVFLQIRRKMFAGCTMTKSTSKTTTTTTIAKRHRCRPVLQALWLTAIAVLLSLNGSDGFQSSGWAFPTIQTRIRSLPVLSTRRDCSHQLCTSSMLQLPSSMKAEDVSKQDRMSWWRRRHNNRNQKWIISHGNKPGNPTKFRQSHSAVALSLPSASIQDETMDPFQKDIIIAVDTAAAAAAPPQSRWLDQWRSKILKLLLLPLRMLLVRPFRLLMEAFIDTLADDGTESIDALPLQAASVMTNTIANKQQQQQQQDVIMNSIPSATITTITPSSPTPTLSASSSITSMTTPTNTGTLLTDTAVFTRPVGDRWAISDNRVDLSGNWTLLVTDEFRNDYDTYLERLGQPRLVRSVALSIVAQTTETLIQSEEGRILTIVGRNIRGIWNRTLVASGTDRTYDTSDPLLVPILSADSETVQAESWWEEHGTVHLSWMRGVTKYGGGSFESRRYLDNDNNGTVVYVCESTFHPNAVPANANNNKNKEPIQLRWKFQRQTSTNQ
ncbi:hypothetical protein IV203_034309 [Nitzschia inconspicua]|uniref:Uncharacterized protein n=1 Tax=Nitzschia inconspicua TaxID=303405 RepID=A0A9K3Q7T1_9STRA|nr:hypothetical protein IV203_034309 [Nitzschia inconspicua]